MANGQGLAAFATGFAGGLMTARQHKEEKARQDKIDSQNAELHQARMEDINRGKQERIALADAVAPRTAQQGTVVDGGQTREFYADPAKVTPELQQDRQIEAEMRAEQAGTKPVSLADAKPGYGVNAGSKAQISTDKPDLASLNSRDAKMQRVVDATMATDPTKALTLSNAVIDNKQKLQSEADNALFRKIHSFQTPDQMADFITAYPHDDMGGNLKASVRRSADGKVWQLVAEKPDGTKVDVPGEFTNDADGMMKARMALAGQFGDPNRRLEFYKWDQEFGRKKAVDANTARHQAVLEGTAQTTAEAAKTRAAAEAKKAEEGSKPPPGYRKTADGNLQAIPGGPADLKLQGAFNQDTAALNSSTSSMDRLAAAANEVMKHPGLAGTAGLRGAIPNIPGSQAADAAALLNTLKSLVAFGVLQDMRNNSKTGGALGSVSDAEGKRLEANLAALEKSQSVEQLKESLQKIIDYTVDAKDRLRGAYNMRHENGARPGQQGQPQNATQIAPKSSAQAQLPRVATPADAMKLPPGTVFIDANGVTRTRP